MQDRWSHFKQYLIDEGYKEFTDDGRPSTVYDYSKRIDKISESYKEDIYSINDINRLEIIKRELDSGGERQNLGNMSHRAVYNAMARYCEFFKSVV